MLNTAFDSFQNIRSCLHYKRMLTQLRANERNISKASFSAKTGYSTAQYTAQLPHAVNNVHVISRVDGSHDMKNKIQQLDKCIKLNHIKKANVCTFLIHHK